MGLGNDSILGKKYLVYFVKSPYSNTNDDAWICAGAIVTPTQILTAAACLVDMNNIYAIAGYKKYVHGRDIEKDKCTSNWKKKIVKISVPKEYSTSNGKQVEWMNVDVGVATVQEPYNFDDQTYLTHCSYAPQSILINYDKENEGEKTRAIALGWGGEKVKESKESKEMTKEKPKPQLLQEATTNIIDNTFCANLVAKNGSKELVNKYLLCASGNGFLGEDGDETISDPILEEFPISTVVLNNGTESGSTDKNIDSAQKNTNISTTSKQINQGDDISSRKSSLLETCQNDHGGPLVTWIGTEETILGVALNGIVNPNFDCVGPRIYVSTASTADIIKCLLETNETRRKICNDQIVDERYQVNDIEIKWPEELKNNTTSPQSIQQYPSFRRQLDNEETPLQIRETRDLRDYDGGKDPQSNPGTIPTDYSQEVQHPYGNKHDNPRANPQETTRSQNSFDIVQEIQHDYLQGKRRAEDTPHENSTKDLHMNHQVSDPQLNPKYTQQNLPQADQTKGSAGRKLNDQNWTLIPKSQQQIESNYSPETMSETQFQSKILALAQSNNKNLMDLYSHLQVHSFIKPQMESQDQPQPPINNDESTNQPVREMNNNPQTSTHLPEIDSFMPSQEHSYKHPQTRFLIPRPVKTNNQALKNILRFSSFEQLPGLDLPPQGESFKETGSQQSKAELSSPTRYSNKEPIQSPYHHKQMEALKPRLTESYNPLDIIMSENQPEDDSFKHSMKEPYRPSIVEALKQSNVDPYIPHPFDSAVAKPIEQQHLSQKYQLNSPRNVRPSSFDPSRAQNALRQRDHALNPPQGNSQIFEQLFSQLQDSRPELWAPGPAPVTTEETFEELYRKLHDGKYEETHEFKTKFDPVKGEFEQTDGSMNEGPQDNVQVRQQKPLEYPDYT